MRDLRGDRMAKAGIREERLRATAGLRRPDAMDGALTSWRGASGRRYVVGVHPVSAPESIADVTEAVVLAVQRAEDGTAALLDIAVPGDGTSRRARLRWLSRMRARGATEMHVHLLAEGEAERRAVLRDLAEAVPSSAAAISAAS